VKSSLCTPRPPIDTWGKLYNVRVAIRNAVTQTATTVRFIWNHPANRHRRLRQLARAFSYQMQARAFHRRVQARIGDRAQVWVDLHRTSASKALYANPPDWPQMRV
jgi:predicted deacylase